MPAMMGGALGRNMAFFLILTATSVVAVNTWSLWNSWQNKITETEAAARNLSVSLGRQAEDSFLQVDITLTDVVRALRQNGLDYAATPAFSLQIREQQGKLSQLHGLFIYDKEGKWVATSGNYVPAKASNADRDYFIWHRTHDDTNLLISNVINSRSTGDLVIPVSMRLNDTAGRFAGVALATVKIDYFRQYYGYYMLGEQDVLGLLLNDTSALYIRPYPNSVINKKISSSPLFKTALRASESGSATWRSALDNIERVYGYARLEKYPLIVAAGYDKNKIWAEWVAANLTAGILNLFLLVLIAGMGLFVLRQVKLNLRNQVELTQVRDELTTINHTLQTLALVDGLTGLANRRQFDALLEEGLQRSHKSGDPISLIMIDIDYFKRFNDVFGHVAGDLCLKKVGGILSNITHGNAGVAARYGGEEFAIILPGASELDAKVMAERAVEAVRNAAITHSSTELSVSVVTVSAGFCSIIADGQENEGERFKIKADKALYEAKNRGRNRAYGYEKIY